MEHCASLEEALPAYQRSSHPLIVVEIQPDATDALRQLRATVDTDQSLLLALVQPDQPGAMQAALQTGVDELLDRLDDDVLDARLALIERRLAFRAEPKQMETALRESQRAMSTLVSNLPGMVYRCQNTPDWPFEFVSEGCRGLTGYPPSAFLNREHSFAELIHPDDRGAVWDQVQTALARQRPFTLTYRLATADGEERWVWEQGEGVFSPEGKLLALEGFMTDITARKRAEEQWRQETERAQIYLDVAGVMFIVVSSDQRVTLINQKGCEVLGYAEAEIVGKNWFDHFIPERMREPVKTIHHQLMRGVLEPVEYFENPVLTRNGEERLIAWRNTAIRDEEGKIMATLSSGIDITEKRRLEREILEISGREQRRIGQELHDGLGSHLTGLALMCRSLARRLDRGKAIEKEEMEEIAHLVKEGSQQARLLARGLNPVKLADQGLQAALQELALNLQKLSGTSVSFESDAEIPRQHSETTLHLYRIAQEAVNNALKHARAQHIWIRLSYKEHQITLAVRDDGVGLPDTLADAEGMGRRVMQYRARMIGAAFRLHNAPDGGTVATCVLPLGETNLAATKATVQTP